MLAPGLHKFPEGDQATDVETFLQHRLKVGSEKFFFGKQMKMSTQGVATLLSFILQFDTQFKSRTPLIDALGGF